MLNHIFPELLLLIEYWLVALAAACWPLMLLEPDLLLELREARDWRMLLLSVATMLVVSSLSSISCSGIRTQSNHAPGMNLIKKPHTSEKEPMARHTAVWSKERGTVLRGRPPY